MAEFDPAKPLKDLKPEKEFFVGVDSDGCAFDTMGIKQRECFCPWLIAYFGLQPVAQAARECKDFADLFSKTRGANRHKTTKRIIAELLPEHPLVKKLGFEAGDVTFTLHHQLRDALNKKQIPIKLVPVNGLVESLRAVKEPEEIELITRAVEITDRAFEYIEETIRPGMTEKEVAWELEKFHREHGSQALPFEIIVAFGPNAALPHAKPSERKIDTGEPVVIDMGSRIEGYCSDLTRTICPGQPDDTYKKVYNIVLGAQLAAEELISEGMSGAEADGFARTVIGEAGYAEAFGHSLGHGVGLAEHEHPRLGPNSKDTLIAGMVFSIEPGIYLPGWGGIRIEDLAVMEKDKVRVLTKSKK